jgi:transcriptional regulator with XRE-family HTH domain
LPFCRIRLSAEKPRISRYPKELKSLGDYLRKRRLDLGLLQREVANRIGVDHSTVTNWEKDNTVPAIRSYPRIIKFLGYEPDLMAPEGLALSIKSKRRALGLSQRRLAKLLNIDEGTVRRRERDRAPTETGRAGKLIGAFLAGKIAPR